MDAEARSSTLKFVNDVALVGARMSHVFHNYASLERVADRRLVSLLRHLDATVQTLNRLAELVKGKTPEKCVLNKQGFQYVETLADECAIAMERIRWIITGDRPWTNAHAPRYWKSLAVANNKGQKELLKPEIDERATYQALKNYDKNGKLGQLGGPMDRFEELQLHLLLVVQVLTIHSMMKTLPSGIDELRDFAEYQSRMCRTARLAGVCGRDGKVLKRKGRVLGSSCSSYSGSDSEGEIISRHPAPPSGSRPRPYNRPPLPPPPGRCGPPPPPPPGWCGPPPPPPPPGWASSRPIFPPKTVPITPSEFTGGEKSTASQTEASPFQAPRVIVIEERDIEHQLPSYSEKDGAPIHGLGGEAPISVPSNDSKVSKSSAGKTSSQAGPESFSKDITAGKTTEQSIEDNTHILNPKSTGFGMKFKSLFRTRASLETEMKRNLADANASLTAFIVQEHDFRKVPHSAFHSLEYTHMRTILSQLKDNTWFKIFSDLTKTEHGTLDLILNKYMQDGKSMQRELVALKVLQQNRFNSWLRVIEACIGAEESGFGYRYENGRIILAIVREKQCDNIKTVLPPAPPTMPMSPLPKPIDRSDQLPAAPVPELLPFMPRDGKVISDLSRPGTLTTATNSQAAPCGFGGLDGGYRPPPSPGWRGPPPPPPPNSSLLEPSRPMPDSVPGHPSPDSGNKNKSQKTISEHSARKALTSYTAFTFRPAPPANTAIFPLIHLPPITWARCSLAREHETKADLQKRIEQFKARRMSIIDMKLQLKEDQSAQVSRLVEELNFIEKDKGFEHTLVELSLVEILNGTVRKPTPGVYVDVIHVIVQRAPKDSVRCVETYNRIVNGPPLSPPFHGIGSSPNGLRRIPSRDSIIVIEPSKAKGRRARRSPASSVTYSSSSSRSNSDSDGYSSSGSERSGRNRRRSGRRGSISPSSSSSSDDDEDQGNLKKRRWKVDPAEIMFDKDEKGKDVVKVLLEKWTGEEKAKEEGKEDVEKDGKEKEKDKKKKKKGKKSRRVIDDDSLAED